jgi:hypothetical protein
MCFLEGFGNHRVDQHRQHGASRHMERETGFPAQAGKPVSLLSIRTVFARHVFVLDQNTRCFQALAFVTRVAPYQTGVAGMSELFAA